MIQARYAGFWVRLGATVLDGLLLLIIIRPMLIAIYGAAYFDTSGWAPIGIWDVVLTYVLPAGAVVLFWLGHQATPGKMVWSARIIDADTGARPHFKQYVVRACAYLLSALPCFLGFLWIAFDRKKQGWHDKIANTLVVR